MTARRIAFGDLAFGLVLVVGGVVGAVQLAPAAAIASVVLALAGIVCLTVALSSFVRRA